MNLQNISHYRREIMGSAILFIMLFHSNVDFSELPYLASLNLVKYLGYCGVDIFFFLSGFSLAVGWSKKKYSLLEFYKKRVSRIFPGFLLIILLTVCSLLITQGFKVSLVEILSRLGIGFVLAKNYEWWFVPAILFCYLIFPFAIATLQKIIAKNNNSIWQLLVVILLIPGSVIVVLLLFSKTVPLILFSRIPNFLLGTFLGILFYRKKNYQISKIHLKSIFYLISVIGISLLIAVITLFSQEVAFNYGLIWYPFIFLTLPLVLILGSTFYFLDRGKNNCSLVLIIGSLNFSGKLSYELFLAHGFLFQFSDFSYAFFNARPLRSLLNTGRFFEYSLLTIGSFLFALIIKEFSILTTRFKILEKVN